MELDIEQGTLIGDEGSLQVSKDDEITHKLAMLIEGECEGLGPKQAADKFGYSQQRYFQIREAFLQHGAAALANKKRGPKSNYRRTDEVERQVIRCRFLDPDANSEVIAQKLRQQGIAISDRSVRRIFEKYGLQKKLYRYSPGQPAAVETQRSSLKTRPEPCDPASLERGVRQMLADKVCGTTVGLWLLAAEHLRLGTWDLLCGWTGQTTERVEPRLALQLVHEAALCTTGVRQRRSLSQKGFELVNGLPWLASDTAIHDLLDGQTVQQARQLQLTLGRLRRASGHFQGKLVVLDPHRVRSYSKRRMQQQCKDSKSKAMKMAQTFFALDGDTEQPICFTTATAARTVSRATQDLLSMAAEILGVSAGESLVVADSEHYTAEVVDHVARAGAV